MAAYRSDRVRHVAERFEVPKERILAWKDETSPCGYLRVDGGTVEVAGMSIGEPLAYTRYANGLLVERACEATAAHEVKRGRRQAPEHPEDFRPRVWVPRDLVDGAQATFRVVAMDKALFFVDATDPQAVKCPANLALRGLRSKPLSNKHVTALAATGADDVPAAHSWFQLGGLVFSASRQASIARGTRTRVEPLNSTRYPIPVAGRRLQVQGAWLTAWGFTPGARYSVTANPIQPSSPLVALTEEGPYTVTALTPGGSTPKLYVPDALLKPMRGKGKTHLQVVGTPLGLVLRRTA
jgi:hypothetical protein